MTTRIRIQLLILLSKLKKDPEYAEKIGVSVL